jgi:hypothetical protein
MKANLFSKRSLFILAAFALFASVPTAGRKKAEVDPRVQQVRSIFIKGNNEAAVKARENLSKWTCFHLAKNASEADGTLEFSQEQSVSGAVFSSNRERSIVSGELTSKDGDVLWSKSVTQDAGLINTGAGSAAHSVLLHLQQDAFPQVKVGFRGVEGCPDVGVPDSTVSPATPPQSKPAPKAPPSEPKEIKLGMTIADVENIMGPPATKVDLGEKVLYKYKDMTVEFHGGKVTDVR